MRYTVHVTPVQRVKRLLGVPFVRGVATFQAGGIAMMVIGLASSVLYARLLGLNQFGLYAAIVAFAGLLTIAGSYGQEVTFTTFLAEAAGRNDRSAARSVLRYFVRATMVASSVFLVLIVILPELAGAFGRSVSTGEYARLVLLNTALQWPSVLLFVLLQLERRYAFMTALESGVDLLQVALSTAFLLFGWGIKGILLGTLIITALTVPLYLWLFARSARRQNLPGLRDAFAHSTGTERGGFAVQGLLMAVDQNIGKNLNPNLFLLVLGATAPIEAVGAFRIALKLASVPLSMVLPSIARMTTVAIPRIAVRAYHELKKACIKVLVGAVSIVSLAIVCGAIFGPPLIPVIYGSEYSPAVPIFLLLLPLNIMAAMHVVSVPLFRVFRRVWLMSIISLIGMGVSMIAYFLLREILQPAMAMTAAVLVYYLHSLLLFPILFRLARSQSSSLHAHPAHH